jgi:hypothetical protein
MKNMRAADQVGAMGQGCTRSARLRTCLSASQSTLIAPVCVRAPLVCELRRTRRRYCMLPGQTGDGDEKFADACSAQGWLVR